MVLRDHIISACAWETDFINFFVQVVILVSHSIVTVIISVSMSLFFTFFDLAILKI